MDHILVRCREEKGHFLLGLGRNSSRMRRMNRKALSTKLRNCTVYK